MFYVFDIKKKKLNTFYMWLYLLEIPYLFYTYV